MNTYKKRFQKIFTFGPRQGARPRPLYEYFMIKVRVGVFLISIQQIMYYLHAAVKIKLRSHLYMLNEWHIANEQFNEQTTH